MRDENKNIKEKNLNKFNLIKIPKSYFTQEEWDEELFDDKVEKFLLDNYNIVLDYYTFEIQDNDLKIFNINSRGSLMENIMQDNFDKKWESKVGDLDNDVLTTSEFLKYLENGKSLLNESIEDNSNNYSVKTVFVTNQFNQGYKKLIKNNNLNVINELINTLKKLLNREISTQKSNHPLKNYGKLKDIHLAGGKIILLYRYDSDQNLTVSLKISGLVDHKELNNKAVKKSIIKPKSEKKLDSKDFITDLKNKANLENQLEESFEIHDTLNPKIFNLETNQMHPEVKKALLNIAKLFIDGLEENKIPLNIVDYHLLGSNAAYNYNKDSDLDVHIIVDIRSLNMDNYNIIANLYNYAKSSFNNKYEFMVKGHPVEIYLEDITLPAKSNGVYSLLNNEWVKVPEKQEPRVINIEETELYKQLENDYNNLTSYEAMDFLDRLYAIRQHSLTTEGEYGDGNLVFKEFRNRGYIDNIKDMIIKLREKNLSLQN